MKKVPWLKPGIWGAVLGAAGMFALLAGTGWTSAGSAKNMADQKVQAAVIALEAPICVARFEQQPDAVGAWKKLAATDSWDQAGAIEKIPGFTVPKAYSSIKDDIAGACANQVLALKEIGGVKVGTN